MKNQKNNEINITEGKLKEEAWKREKIEIFKT